MTESQYGRHPGSWSGVRRTSLCLLLLAVSVACFLPLAAVALPKTRSIVIYALMPTSDGAAVARKQQRDLQNRGIDSNADEVTIRYLTIEEQRKFLRERSESCVVDGVTAVSVFEAVAETSAIAMQTEIFKWCAFATAAQDTVAWLDSSSPILNSRSLFDAMLTKSNVAVLSANSVHGSYFQLSSSERNKELSMNMLRLLLTTDVTILQTHALFVPTALHELLDQDKLNWTFWDLLCRKGTHRQQLDNQNHLACHTANYCCSIHDGQTTLLLSRHYVIPYQNTPEKLPMKPLHAARGDDDAENPFVSTITVKHLATEKSGDTPNFYDLLQRNQCLPEHENCTKCLREKNGATCESCATQCHCYCEKLCHTVIPSKRVVEEWTISPPLYTKDPARLIPRIVHQTWFEELDPESYPNMSRLVESFKQSGWEYRFYTDDDAVSFLQRHFPVQVLEAYEALTPGAFKADLFRYCVLLISGGVYADVDVHLESALDMAIPSDVGFMVPIDEPGKPVRKQMCLWNGFIASAPSHPFLVKALETVVNQVRNRFTSVDIDATFCPNPELSVLHAYDTLFTAGPCLLGSSLNRVIGRNAQTSHVPGELRNLWTGKQRSLSEHGTSFVNLGKDSTQSIEQRIPGRTVILHQNKWDMGAHRFTNLELNLVVAATDLPDSNDRDKVNSENDDENKHEHYSKAHAKTGVYGVEHLYSDRESADEVIRIVIDASMFTAKQLSSVA